MDLSSLVWCISSPDQIKHGDLVSKVGRLVDCLRLSDGIGDTQSDNDNLSTADHALNAAKSAEKLINQLYGRISELERMAETDELTGLLNRRGFINQLNRVLATANRYEERGVLVYVDLDDFKLTNDTYGHAAGDEVLRQVAHLLRHSIRDSDYVGRLGGDEFTVLLTRTSWENGLKRAESLETKLNNIIVNWRGKMIVVAASLGLQGYGVNDVSLNLLRRADEAMYETKRLRTDPENNTLSVRQADI